MKERKDYVMYFDLYEFLPIHDELNIKDYVLGPKQLSESEFNQLEKLAQQSELIYQTWRSTNEKVIENSWTEENKKRFRQFTEKSFIPLLQEIKEVMEEIIEVDTYQYYEDYNKLTNKFNNIVS